MSWLTSWICRDKISAISTEEHETGSGDDLDLYGDSDNRKLRSAELMPRIANVEAALVWVAAAPTFLLVLNIHLAHSTVFQLSFLSRGDGLPVIGGLLALAIGGNRLPLSLTKGN